MDDCSGVDTTTSFAGFLAWIRFSMRIDVEYLPDDSPWINFAYCVAKKMVDHRFRHFAIIYQQMVYNLAGDTLINYAQDVDGQNFFEELREKWKIGGFHAGVVNSTTDLTDSVSLQVIEAAATFTLQDLQALKTPYGRTYMQFAQLQGDAWGIS
jgi:hypothetical protein